MTKTDGQMQDSYSNEFITAEAAKSIYGRSFGELMSAADRGLIERHERMPDQNGRVTYTFRRGDIISMEADNGNA